MLMYSPQVTPHVGEFPVSCLFEVPNDNRDYFGVE